MDTDVYQFNPKTPIYSQVHPFVYVYEKKHGVKPNILYLHPDNIQGGGRIITRDWSLIMVPDLRQQINEFQLGHGTAEFKPEDGRIFQRK